MQYKLKKLYPGLPKDWEIGMLVSNIITSEYFKPCDLKYTCGHIFNNYVVDYPKFWEKVVEKDYEILSFISISPYTNNETSTRLYNGDHVWLHDDKPQKKFSEDVLLDNKNYTIHSIKRLSDGGIFSIGDKTVDGVITKFEILDGILIVFIYNNTWLRLDLLKKVKQPIFKTEDGVELYPDDKCKLLYIVTPHSYTIVGINKRINKNTTFGKFLWFSTKEKAEEYILMNKPCLSIKDCMQVMSMFTMEDELKEIVKQKLK